MQCDWYCEECIEEYDGELQQIGVDYGEYVFNYCVEYEEEGKDDYFGVVWNVENDFGDEFVCDDLGLYVDYCCNKDDDGCDIVNFLVLVVVFEKVGQCQFGYGDELWCQYCGQELVGDWD